MSTINSYKIGQVVRLRDVVTVDGTPTDPTGVYTFQLTDPRGIRTTYVFNADPEFVQDSPSEYHVDWLIAHHGEHRYRFSAGDGVAEGANEGMFRAAKSVFE